MLERDGIPARPSLRDWILGGWSLRRYHEQPQGQETPNYPLGEDAEGLLIYTADGFMSAVLMRANRPPFASGDWFGPSREEVVAASAFVAYSGPFVVDEAARTITHDIAISFFPNLIGQRQVRVAGVQENDLTLTPAAPIRSGGRLVAPQLRWRRANQPEIGPAIRTPW